MIRVFEEQEVGFNVGKNKENNEKTKDRERKRIMFKPLKIYP